MFMWYVFMCWFYCVCSAALITMVCIILSPGSGEDRCLHEVRQIHEDTCEQQDGQVGKQEGVEGISFTP